MSASNWIENTCDAMIAKLNAELPAKIEAINAEATDGLLVDMATGISIGERAEPTYPWIVVAPTRTALDLDTGERLINKHLITLESVYWAAGEDELIRKLLRFARAVREVALANRYPGINLGEGGWGLRWEGDQYGRMIKVQNESFIKMVGSNFSIRQQEPT
jgi:hypothetical protein